MTTRLVNNIARQVFRPKTAASVKSGQVEVTRKVVTSLKGEILADPEKTRFGLLKVTAVAVPGVLIGATLAKNGAAWLEENEIFIPDDDDDD